MISSSAGDLLYNIFCCVKLGSSNKRSKAARNTQFNKDVKLFNKDRDLGKLQDEANLYSERDFKTRDDPVQGRLYRGPAEPE